MSTNLIFEFLDCSVCLYQFSVLGLSNQKQTNKKIKILIFSVLSSPFPRSTYGTSTSVPVTYLSLVGVQLRANSLDIFCMLLFERPKGLDFSRVLFFEHLKNLGVFSVRILDLLEFGVKLK